MYEFSEQCMYNVIKLILTFSIKKALVTTQRDTVRKERKRERD